MTGAEPRAVADLLTGASLRVVLHPRADVQTAFPDMIESFDLPHVLIVGDTFIGKTANRHATPYNYQELKAYDFRYVSSYAYANYLDIVVNCSHTAPLFRAYDKRSYRAVRFITRPNYVSVWEYGGETSVAAVERAIDEGKMLKIALLDEDDTWNLHPVDMPSYHIGKDFFELFTEQDAVPAQFRDPQRMRQLQEGRIQLCRQTCGDDGTRDPKILNLSATIDTPEFYSTFYTVHSNGNYLRGQYPGGNVPFMRYKSLKIFAEL